MAIRSDLKIRRKRAREWAALFETVAMRSSFGMHLSYDEKAVPLIEMPYNPAFEHGLGDLHGGVIATMLDNAGWFAAAVHYDYWIFTSDLHTRFLEPANHELLRATGRVTRAGERVATTSMEVRSESGRLVAVGTASFLVTLRRFQKP